MHSLLVIPLALLSAVFASPFHKRAPGATWTVSQFNTLVTFGDSYTDENRLNYFGQNNNTAPPPGTFLPEVSYQISYPLMLLVHLIPRFLELQHCFRRSRLGPLRCPIHRLQQCKRKLEPSSHAIRLRRQWRRL